MKSVVLVPYCPWPADTGGKVEMWKHLKVLRELGPCTILSAAGKPVGGGWTADARQIVERLGFRVVLREEEYPGKTLRQWGGMAYATATKGLGLEKAFGHSNPYHRFAFPPDWFYAQTRGADLAVINYSYWAHLPSAVPKALVLLDLWSNFMWGSARKEQRDMKTCDAVFVISKDEERQMQDWGLRRLIWSPPAMPSMQAPLNDRIGMVGSANRFNIEGLRWFETAARRETPVHVYGPLADEVRSDALIPVGRYIDNAQPYKDCGIVLFATTQGMGVQIKTIEALAAGRAIVARRGAVRGLPPGDGAWMEVDTPSEMRAAAAQLATDSAARLSLGAQAHAYYRQHLDQDHLLETIRATYRELAGGVR